jgi:hypothetical protein
MTGVFAAVVAYIVLVAVAWALLYAYGRRHPPR